MNWVLAYLRGHAVESGVGEKQLLLRYAKHRDHDAFAELVHRHGPLVWGVCRRNLISANQSCSNRRRIEICQPEFLFAARRRLISKTGIQERFSALHFAFKSN
jgi:hypothetical protein